MRWAGCAEGWVKIAGRERCEVVEEVKGGFEGGDSSSTAMVLCVVF